MGATSRDTHDGEAFDTKVVRELHYVVRPVDQATTGLEVLNP